MFRDRLIWLGGLDLPVGGAVSTGGKVAVGFVLFLKC